jgi:hypothetical protein
MSEVARRVIGRRAAMRALVAAVLLAGVVGGWAAGSGLKAHPASTGERVVATDGTIISEN